jgi:hypothetical protein
LQQLPLLFSPVDSCDNQRHPMSAIGRNQSG